MDNSVVSYLGIMLCVFYEEQCICSVSRGLQETIVAACNQLAQNPCTVVPPAYNSAQNDKNRFFAQCHKIAIGAFSCYGKTLLCHEGKIMNGVSYP